MAKLQESQTEGKSGEIFESRVQNARSAYEEYRASKGPDVPQSGTYISKMKDRRRGDTSIGKVNLTFKESDDGKGYMISGTSTILDGNTVIGEGYVSFDGMRAW